MEPEIELRDIQMLFYWQPQSTHSSVAVDVSLFSDWAPSRLRWCRKGLLCCECCPLSDRGVDPTQYDATTTEKGERERDVKMRLALGHHP